MIQIETPRLIIRSNLYVDKRQLTPPPEPQGKISILNLTPLSSEDTGFAVYLKSNESIQIAHFAFRFDRCNYELSYGTEEPYRRKGYLYEALSAFLCWFFDNIDAESINGLIANNNTPSIRLAQKLGFQPRNEDGQCTWYELKKPLPHN